MNILWRGVLAFVMLCFAASGLHAQWQWGNPDPQGNDLWNVDFAPSSQTGWAVGAAGMIVKSTDGGASWFTQESGREDFLRGVEAIDANTAWVVGDNGVVLRSTNGGSTWIKQNSGTTAGINTLHAVSASTAWFVGDAGMLRATQNGGMTWTAQNTGTSNNLNGVFFTSVTHGVAVGSTATVVRTTNGGSSWSPVTLPGGPGPGSSAHLLDVFFVDASFGWTCGGGGTLYLTTNGGFSWSRTMNNGLSADINRVRFTTRLNGWAVGESGALHRTTTGGSSWTTLTSGTSSGLEGLALTGGNVVVVGLFGDILRSTNGTAFSMVTSGVRSTFNAVSAAVPSSAWAVGSGGVIARTVNSGADWTVQNSGTSTALFGVDNINGRIVVACGNGGLILRSSNSGSSWSPVASGTTVALNNIDLLDNGTGYIVGGSGRLLKTTNAGVSWYRVATGTLESLYGVHFTDADNGTVVGANGTVLGTTNGGYTWSSQQPWTQDALFGVIREGQLGMLCGDGGTAAVTTDGGQSWSSVYPATSAALFHLAHPATNEFAAVGANGTIMRTSDFGQSWVREISHAENTLYGADAHGGTVYAVGDFGMALRNGSYPYPVTLRSFTAQRRDDGILLHWVVEDETQLMQYDILRNSGGEWENAGTVYPSRGANGTGRRTGYRWIDGDAPAREIRYRLRMVDFDGSIALSPVVHVRAETLMPRTPSIDVWPNPARDHLSVRHDGAPSGSVLRVIDLTGRELYAVSVSSATSGIHRIPSLSFNTEHFVIVLLQSPGSIVSRKVLIRQ